CGFAFRAPERLWARREPIRLPGFFSTTDATTPDPRRQPWREKSSSSASRSISCAEGALPGLAGCRRESIAKGRVRQADRPYPEGLCRQGTDHPRGGGAPSTAGAGRDCPAAPVRGLGPTADTTAPPPQPPGRAAAPPPGPAASRPSYAAPP